jgi:hypothetical protein
MGKTITETQTDSDSIELSKTAKGTYTWSIKCYGVEEDTVLAKIAKIEKELDTKYSKVGKDE